MAKNDPGEWDSVTVADVVRVTDAGPARALAKIGLVQRPGGDGPRLALQVDDETRVIVPPEAAARLIGALYRGLREVSALAANARRW